MTKNELLKKIGFSDEYINLLDKHELSGLEVISIKQPLDSSVVGHTCRDTNSLIIKKSYRKDSNSLWIG